MKTATTRRGLMKAAPIAAAALVIPCTATAMSVDRRTWDAAFAKWAKRKAEDDAFTPGWLQTTRICTKECEAIPHTTLRPDPHTGRHLPVSTADRHYVARARDTVVKVDAGKMRFDEIPSLQDHLQLCRDVAVAADERDRQVEVVRAKYDMDALDDEAEKLGGRVVDAQDLLMAMPAPDLAALHWKLNRVTDGGSAWECWSDEYTAQLRADIARLLPREA